MSLFVSRDASPTPSWSPTIDDASPQLGHAEIDLGEYDTPCPSPGSVRKFRFRGRFCLLTYSQVDRGFDFSGIVDHVVADGALCVIGRERHSDGGTHYHAFIDYRRVRDFSGPTRWDVRRHHPNLLPVSRTPWRALQYAIKDGDVVHDDFDEKTRPTEPSGHSGSSRGRSKRNFDEITAAVDKEDFFNKMQRLDPRALVVSFGNVAKFADWKFPDIRREHQSPTGIAISIDTPDLLRQYRGRLGRTGR